MTPNKLARWAIGFVAVATLAAACTDDDDQATDETTTTVVEADDSSGDAAEVGTIAEVAAADGRFTTLLTAVEAAGLADTLSTEELTVFAPTDDAFAALPDGTVESLLDDPEGALTNVLTYHVVEGAVPASDVVGLDGQSVATLNGETVAISVDGETVKVNDATVVITDVEASNGIIHVIDAVLIPPTS